MPPSYGRARVRIANHLIGVEEAVRDLGDRGRAADEGSQPSSTTSAS
ncbi:MAG: hypothetical protein HOY76_26610 [Streptomyces sp.]|nr:hypothetical protein [Streptomyces sp.]